MDTMKIKYEFFFKDGRTEVIELSLDAIDLSLEPLLTEVDEPWTKLDFHQCQDCPLDPAKHALCPVARNLSSILLRFRDDVSFAPVVTRVTTNERTTEKRGTLEIGVSALMGLIMATSGCPILDRFKPMAFTHLPFANENETMFRAVSTYLTAQFIRMTKGKAPDWGLEKLEAMYGKITRINSAFSERVRELKGKDANISALVVLDVFAQFGSFTLTDNWVEKVESFFSAYLDE